MSAVRFPQEAVNQFRAVSVSRSRGHAMISSSGLRIARARKGVIDVIADIRVDDDFSGCAASPSLEPIESGWNVSKQANQDRRS